MVVEVVVEGAEVRAGGVVEVVVSEGGVRTLVGVVGVEGVSVRGSALIDDVMMLL